MPLRTVARCVDSNKAMPLRNKEAPKLVRQQFPEKNLPSTKHCAFPIYLATSSYEKNDFLDLYFQLNPSELDLPLRSRIFAIFKS